MFSFRRKSKSQQEAPRIRSSPSLPQLNSPGIPWPTNLVDVSSIRQEQHHSQGAAKTSFQGVDDSPIPFHKPFRASTGKRPDGIPISSLYMSNSPVIFDDWKSTPPKSAGRYSQRRARVPPTFNLMVHSFLFNFTSLNIVYRSQEAKAPGRLRFYVSCLRLPMSRLPLLQINVRQSIVSYEDIRRLLNPSQLPVLRYANLDMTDYYSLSLTPLV